VLKLPPWVAGGIVALLAVLTFAPFKFLHPMRVARLRWLNVAAVIAWSALALIEVLNGLDAGPWVAGGLVVIALYVVAVGLIDRR
jgi:phosphatidylcholine synthase